MELIGEAVDAKYYNDGSIKPWTTEDFDQIYRDFGAISELPAITMVPEILAAYPDAKVVLVERQDIDAWYDSYCKAIVPQSFNPWIQCVFRHMPLVFVNVADKASGSSQSWTSGSREEF